MQTPLLMNPRSIPTFGRHIPNITEIIYVGVTFLCHKWRPISRAAGPKDEKGTEGFESAFKALGSCVTAASFSVVANSDVLFTASFMMLVSNLRPVASSSPPRT